MESVVGGLCKFVMGVSKDCREFPMAKGQPKSATTKHCMGPFINEAENGGKGKVIESNRISGLYIWSSF